jgi:hypothetical protein
MQKPWDPSEAEHQQHPAMAPEQQQQQQQQQEGESGDTNVLVFTYSIAPAASCHGT